MIDANTLDRLQGAAVGAAVGDALGMPLELKPLVPLEKYVRSMQAGRLPAGSFTDDTEMALALAESLLEKRPLDGSVLVKHFLNWYKAGPEDIDNHTRTVLDTIKRVQSWEKASAEVLRFRPDSSGNGSIMRCWPVALACWNDREQLVADSTLQSRVTHPHLDCIAGSIFVNVWIAELVQGKPVPEAYLAALDSAKLSEPLTATLKKAPMRRREELENSGWVRRTLETAVWAILTTNTFADAVVQAANLGNDANTSACVTGAIAGAAYGIGAIPPSWRQQLRGEWPLRSGKTWKEADFIGLVNKLVGKTG
jgi:ADP-ribosyl-[dinitrogen reductase] hydrolase